MPACGSMPYPGHKHPRRISSGSLQVFTQTPTAGAPASVTPYSRTMVHQGAPPSQVGAKPDWRDELKIYQRFVLLLAVIGSVFGVGLAFVPLPVQDTGGTCGPRLSSDSAIGVELDPSSVDIGSTGGSPLDLADWRKHCEGVAHDRLLVAGVIAGGSIVVGGAGAWLFGRRRRAVDTLAVR